MITTFRNRLHRYMALPAVLLFTVFFLLPLCQGIGISLTDYNGIAPPRFIGLGNFLRFLRDERAMHDIGNTLQFGLASAVLLNLFGLAYALLFDGSTHGRRIGRTLVYMPAVISGLVMGYIWLMILSPQTGSLDRMLSQLGLSALYRDTLGDMNRAMGTIIAVNVWQWVGGPMIIYLAGLQAIPVELHEAAHMDGAGAIRCFRHITLPLLVPSIRINVVTNLIGSLGVFDVITALTDGGPGYATESLSIFIYRNAYGGATGYATAVAVVLFLLVLVPVLFSLSLLKTDTTL